MGYGKGRYAVLYVKEERMPTRFYQASSLDWQHLAHSLETSYRADGFEVESKGV
jgi:hypothetical protein